MAITLKEIEYRTLNPKQKENYNFLKISAVLADYGFITMRLSDDWQGADFIAQNIDGTFLKVQLKSRLTFETKYQGKDLYVAFCSGGDWYLYPHDELLSSVLQTGVVEGTRSWESGGYSFPRLSEQMQELLQPFKVVPIFGAIE